MLIPRLVVVSLAFVAVAAGCSSESDESAPALGALEQVTADSALPFEAYTLSESESIRMKKAYTTLVRRCGSEKGVELIPLENRPPSQEDQDSAMWNGRFGTMTLDHAQTYGYHAGPGEPASQSSDLFVDQGLPENSAALDGVNGCIAAVQKRIGADPMDLQVPQAEKFRLAAYRDKRTQKAEAEWAACMKSSGFSYSTIDEPTDSIAGNALTHEETRIAIADVKCTESSKWRDISFAIEAGYQARALENDPESYATARDTALKALKNAESAAGQE